MLYRTALCRLASATFDGAARVLAPLGLDCFFSPSRMWHGDGAGWCAWTRTGSGVVVAIGPTEVTFSRR